MEVKDDGLNNATYSLFGFLNITKHLALGENKQAQNKQAHNKAASERLTKSVSKQTEQNINAETLMVIKMEMTVSIRPMQDKILESSTSMLSVYFYQVLCENLARAEIYMK